MDSKSGQFLPVTEKQQNKYREVGKVKQISDKVERTKVPASELHRNMPTKGN